MSYPALDARSSYQQVWEAVCVRLRKTILAGELAAGEKLVEADLARAFGVSRGPIREALRALSREGLVIDLPRRGTVVCSLTQADLMEVYGVREALELISVREVVERISDADITKLGEAYAKMDEAWRGNDWNAAVMADKRFHFALVKLAKNSRMEAIYEQMVSQTILLLVTAAEADVSLRSAPLRAVHRAILDAVVARDSQRAGDAISNHYRYTRDRLFERIQLEG